jgi:hypothetical protein
LWKKVTVKVLLALMKTPNNSSFQKASSKSFLVAAFRKPPMIKKLFKSACNPEKCF